MLDRKLEMWIMAGIGVTLAVLLFSLYWFGYPATVEPPV